MSESEDDFLARMREQLRDSESRIDAQTLHRLREAREHALAARRPWRRGWLAGGLSLAGGTALALVLWLHQPPAGVPLEGEAVAEFIAQGEEDMALYDDLEFYQWLADMDGAG